MLSYSADHLPGLHPWLRSVLLGGGLYVALFFVVHVALAATATGIAPVDLVLLVLVCAPQVVYARRRGADIGRLRGLLIAAALVAAGALGFWSTFPAAPDATYAAWFLGAITFDLLGLALLGALEIAWSTMAALVVLSGIWAVSHGLPVAEGPVIVVRHVATLLIGTLLVVSLRRSRSAFVAFQAARMRRSTEEEAARARAAARRIAAERVLEQAGPTLEALAAGRPLSADDRRQLLVLEGALRDQIRTPLLVCGALRDSVTAARRRGVNVMLMDEAEQADAAVRVEAAAWLAERLDATGAGGFVGRLRDLGDAVRVSAVNDDHGDARSFPLSDAPAPEQRPQEAVSPYALGS
ncbi:hypothetical protein [Amnibacterium endophyticum]|uniref:Uncharacterized protein n=1 Tax=Amnibacterium endophyticum TaxID=2109337 RepID=A0ABW4L9B7_9MICO